MHFLLDTNILLYAKMDAMPQHRPVSKWLVQTLADTANSVLVCETSILAFLRVSTNKRIFDPPLPINEAITFLNDVLDHPATSIFVPSPGHFAELGRLIRKHGLIGDLAMDANLAVIAISTGATLATADKDFKRIPYLKLFDPTRNSGRKEE